MWDVNFLDDPDTIEEGPSELGDSESTSLCMFCEGHHRRKFEASRSGKPAQGC